MIKEKYRLEAEILFYSTYIIEMLERWLIAKPELTKYLRRIDIFFEDFWKVIDSK